MLEFFTTTLPPIFQGITVNQDLKYIREYYNGVIDKVISYRSENIWFVKGEHILNRFLKLFLSPESMKDIEYFKMIDTYSNSACRNLQFSTMYNTGNFHKNNIFKGSIRSKEFVDVSKVCSYFNGGGHTRAAGCVIEGDFKTVVNLFLEKLKSEYPDEF